jgi:hypothetical protein
MEIRMPFVNERITGNDWERYNIPDIERRIVPSVLCLPCTCTIDRERGISLLKMSEQCEMRPGSDHRWPTGLCGWVFMWHGHELWVETKWLERGGESKGHGWGRLRLLSLCLMGEKFRTFGDKTRLPPELMPHREEILKDLYDAFLAYQEVGIFSTLTSYDLQLEVSEGV